MYDRFEHLVCARHDNGVLVVTLNRPEVLNATDEVLHRELSEIWPVIDSDESVRVVVVRGAGRAFSAGGDLAMVEHMTTDDRLRERVMNEARAIVYNMLACTKPIVSAVHGPAVGAGLVVALLADIAIVANDARIIDGHTRLGVAAGDHAALVWPMLCGMAKAKYHLLLCESISGSQAEAMGMVAQSVAEEDVVPRAMEVANQLAGGAQQAIRLTKMALNGWYRQALPIFDASWAAEAAGFAGPDVVEGIASHREKRPPRFNPS